MGNNVIHFFWLMVQKSVLKIDCKFFRLIHLNLAEILRKSSFNSIQEAREVPWAPRSKWGTPSRSRLDQGFSAWQSLGNRSNVGFPDQVWAIIPDYTPSTSVLPNKLFLVLIKCWWIELPFLVFGLCAFTIMIRYYFMNKKFWLLKNPCFWKPTYVILVKIK